MQYAVQLWYMVWWALHMLYSVMTLQRMHVGLIGVEVGYVVGLFSRAVKMVVWIL